MALNSFSSSTVINNASVTSTLDASAIITTIQSMGPDSYFDNTNQLGYVNVYYTHQEGRQIKRIVHDPVYHQGTVSWSPNARDGTWQKSMLKVFDLGGAENRILRAFISPSEDITHLDGTTYLNT